MNQKETGKEMIYCKIHETRFAPAQDSLLNGWPAEYQEIDKRNERRKR